MLRLRDRADGDGDRGDHAQAGDRPGRGRDDRRRRRSRPLLGRRSHAGSASRGSSCPTSRPPSRPPARCSRSCRPPSPRPRSCPPPTSTSRAPQRSSASSAPAARRFSPRRGRDVVETAIRFSVEARYPHQVWEIEVPLRSEPPRYERRSSSELRQDFHAAHEELFAMRDEEAPVELVTWRAHVRCALRHGEVAGASTEPSRGTVAPQRNAYFPGLGVVATSRPQHRFGRCRRAPRGAADPRIAGDDCRARRAGAPSSGSRAARLLIDPLAGGAASSPTRRHDDAAAQDLATPARATEQPLRGRRARDDEHAAADRALGDSEHCARLLLLHPHRRRRAARDGREPADPRDERAGSDRPVHEGDAPDVATQATRSSTTRPTTGTPTPPTGASSFPSWTTRACTGTPCWRRRTSPTAATPCRRRTWLTRRTSTTRGR